MVVRGCVFLCDPDVMGIIAVGIQNAPVFLDEILEAVVVRLGRQSLRESDRQHDGQHMGMLVEAFIQPLPDPVENADAVSCIGPVIGQQAIPAWLV